MKIFRTTSAPPRPSAEEEESKVVIFTPLPDEDTIAVPCGVLHFAGEHIQVSVIDPRGVEWDHHESIEQLARVIREFLESDDDWLQLVTPTNGEPMLLTRELAARVITIESAVAKQRKDMQRPNVPDGVRLVRADAMPFAVHGPGKHRR